MPQTTSQIYLVFADASTNSNKFWSATAHADGTLTTTWGRIGYNGQTKVYSCGSYNKAISKLNTLATTKKQKGYKESQLSLQSLEEEKIRRALQLLEQIRPCVQTLNFCELRYLQVLNEYLAIVPTPLGMNINPTTIYQDVTAVDYQVQLLRELLSSDINVENSTPSTSQQIMPKPISLKSISNLFWKL